MNLPIPRVPRLPLALGLAMLLLAGCGFHLRNALQLPPDLGPLRVVAANEDSPLVLELRDALRRGGAVVASPGAGDAAATATLQVVSERWGENPISIDEFGRSQEFNLRYAVIFRLQRADGTDLVPQQAIELSRDYVSVPTESAGTAGEREILARELRREMLSAVLRRIDVVSRLPRVEGDTP